MRLFTRARRALRASALSPRKRGYELLLIKYKLLFDHARDIILFIDSDGKILEANNAAVKAYGYSREELVSMRVFELRKFDSADLVRSQMRQADNSSILFETVHKTRDGRAIPVEVSSTGVNFGGSRILMSIIRDISLKQRYLAEIHRLAYYDELTGLPNRKSFQDALRRASEASGGAFALMLIDVDDFKRVNDAHSHAVGDKYLTEIGLSLSRALADRGTLFRLGGDEFTVLATDFASKESVTPLLEDLRAAGGGTFEIDGNSIKSSVSIGVSFFPENGRDGSEVLKKADLAMYRVKETRKDGYGFYG